MGKFDDVDDNRNEKIGKLKNYSHPRLHPTRNQKRAGDVRRCSFQPQDVSLWVRSVEHMDMGSFILT